MPIYRSSGAEDRPIVLCLASLPCNTVAMETRNWVWDGDEVHAWEGWVIENMSELYSF